MSTKLHWKEQKWAPNTNKVDKTAMVSKVIKKRVLSASHDCDFKDFVSNSDNSVG